MAKFENIDGIIISEEEEQAIKNKSPANLPLNPTSQGWTGAAIRAMLTNYVVGDSESTLALMKEKYSLIKTLFDDTSSEVTYTQTQVNQIFTILDTNNIDSYTCIAGEAITRGDLLMRNGVASGYVQVIKAHAINQLGFHLDPTVIIGFATSSVALGETLVVKTEGILYELDTSSFSIDDTLYANPTTPGALQNTAPSGYRPVRIAICVISDALHGAIYIKEVIIGGLEEIPAQADEPGADYTGVYWFETDPDGESNPIHDDDGEGTELPTGIAGDQFILLE